MGNICRCLSLRTSTAERLLLNKNGNNVFNRPCGCGLGSRSPLLGRPLNGTACKLQPATRHRAHILACNQTCASCAAATWYRTHTDVADSAHLYIHTHTHTHSQPHTHTPTWQTAHTCPATLCTVPTRGVPLGQALKETAHKTGEKASKNLIRRTIKARWSHLSRDNATLTRRTTHAWHTMLPCTRRQQLWAGSDRRGPKRRGRQPPQPFPTDRPARRSQFSQPRAAGGEHAGVPLSPSHSGPGPGQPGPLRSFMRAPACRTSAADGSTGTARQSDWARPRRDCLAAGCIRPAVRWLCQRCTLHALRRSSSATATASRSCGRCTTRPSCNGWAPCR